MPIALAIQENELAHDDLPMADNESMASERFMETAKSDLIVQTPVLNATGSINM